MVSQFALHSVRLRDWLGSLQWVVGILCTLRLISNHGNFGIGRRTGGKLAIEDFGSIHDGILQISELQQGLNVFTRMIHATVQHVTNTPLFCKASMMISLSCPNGRTKFRTD